MDTDLSHLIDGQQLVSELEAIAGESIGWIPLASNAYLHVGNREDEYVHVVGVADSGMAGMNVLLLG